MQLDYLWALKFSDKNAYYLFYTFWVKEYFMCRFARQQPNLFYKGVQKNDNRKYFQYIGYLKLDSAKWTLFTVVL
jgi:hypothetical protein